MVIDRPNFEPNKYYTPKEGAALLGVHFSTLVKWSHIPGVGLTRYKSKKTHQLYFKGCDLLHLWEGDEI